MSVILKWLRSLLFFRKEKDTDSYALKTGTHSLTGNGFIRSAFQNEDCETHQSSCDREGLLLKLRRGSCLAWSELESWRMADMELYAELDLKNEGCYAACGIIFRKNEDDNYYIFLVSSKNWWRLDVVFNGKPRTLIPWTEVPEVPEELARDRPDGSLSLRVIAIDTRIALVINDSWAGEVEDDTLAAGTLALALVNYDEEGSPSVRMEKLDMEGHSHRVEEAWIRWTAWLRPRRAARLALARSFMAMGQASAALVQIQRIWKRSENRLGEELLLAVDAAIRLALLDEARTYLDELCAASGTPDTWPPELLDRQSTLLYLEGNYVELEANTRRYLAQFGESRVQRSLLAHALSNQGHHEEAAEEYTRAAVQTKTTGPQTTGAHPPATDDSPDAPAIAGDEADAGSGILLKNAAQELERCGNAAAALERYLEAGSRFLKADDYGELGLLIPTVLQIGLRDPRAHALCAKYHFAREEWHAARLALKSARSLAQSAPAGKDGEKESRLILDPAVPYLEALLLIREGSRKQAIPLLEEACALDPDYFPFLFRLLESRWLLGARKDRKKLDDELARALAHPDADGWLYNMAAQIDMERGDLDRAAQMLERAVDLLGPVKEVMVNRAALAASRGESDEALAILDRIGVQADPLVETTRGNILYQTGQLEEAEEAFRIALRASGDEPEQLRNLAGCLMDQGRFGEADELLARACERDPGAKTLELTAYVASKKGEYPRAEAALKMALELEPDSMDLLFSLAWNLLRQSRSREALETAARIKILQAASKDPSGEQAKRLQELEEAIRATTHRSIHCARCARLWEVPRELPPQGALRLVAEPPNDMPAGTCPSCGKTWCIGCVKDTLKEGRFQCPDCSQALKLNDDGLKKILTDWLAGIESAPSL